MTIPQTLASALARGLAAAALATLALVLAAPARADGEPPLLLVHGYGQASVGKDCNGDTWREALSYYEQAAGRARSSMVTIGYYAGSKPGTCDVLLGERAHADNDRPIQDVARELAEYIAGRGEPVNIIAHSMGGLVTRVALLGSAQGWKGFPPKLNVQNVVTLSTPYQGLGVSRAANWQQRRRTENRQLRQMLPGSAFLQRLHAPGSGLDDAWAAGTDWTLIGSEEDGTVSYVSALDDGYAANQRFGYRADASDAEVGHSAIRRLSSPHRYDLDYWHAAGGHPTHHTVNGWAPLKAAYQAATAVGDNLPR